MAELISSSNISEAWLEAMNILAKEGGETTNLIVCLRPPVLECLAITAALDALLKPDPKVFSVSKVAGTLFPWEFYLPDRLGAEARQHLYESHRLARVIEDRRSRKRNYFDRMVRWHGRDGQEINQLERKICYYQKKVKRNHQACNAFEVSLARTTDPYAAADVGQNDMNQDDMSQDDDVLIYDPEKDSSPYGFPCLSHISISLSKNKLHLTATYRNQHFLRKAYGNYLGLLRLLNFLAREIGVEAGELVCISTHADDEMGTIPSFKPTIVGPALLKCRRLLQAAPSVPTELHYIRPGMSQSKIYQPSERGADQDADAEHLQI